MYLIGTLSNTEFFLSHWDHGVIKAELTYV